MWQKRIFFVNPLSSAQWARVITWGIWVAVAYTAGCWGLKTWGLGSPMPVATQAQNTPTLSPAPVQLAQALGASTGASVPAQAAAPLKLLGVVFAEQGQGVALIAVGAEPAKPYRVGQTVAQNWVVQSTFARKVMLATSPNAEPTLVLELPPMLDARTSGTPDSESPPRKDSQAP